MKLHLHFKNVHGQRVWIVDHRYIYSDGSYTVWHRSYFDTWAQAYSNLLRELEGWRWQSITSS